MLYDKNMVKVLPILLVILLAGTLYFRSTFSLPFISQNQTKDSSISVLPALPDGQGSSEDRINTLEKALTLVIQKVNELNSKTANSSGDSIKSLESTVASLQNKVVQLEQKLTGAPVPTPTSTTSSKKSVVYIPLGSSSSDNYHNYRFLPGFEASLDPADFPGYSSMQIEVNMRLIESLGRGYASLLNYTDNQTLSASEVSTTSTSYVLLASSGFTLPVGKKNYRLQLKTTEGSQLYIQNARIKVNF